MLTEAVPDWRRAAEQEYRDRRQMILDRRLDVLRQIEEMQKEVGRADREIAELDNAARTFGIPAPEEKAPSAEPSPSGALFKDTVLDVLRESHPVGMKAKEVRRLVEGGLQRAYHPKTTGMTLYRLAQENLVRREGHTWYLVGQKTEGPDSSEPSDDLLNRA